jgi:probable F420-dependent oxidoreductase
MEFWQAVSFVPADQLPVVARAAEAAGFTGLAIPDHLMTPLRLESRYPYSKDADILWDPAAPFPEPWMLATWLATVTQRLRFLSYVYVLPLRDPFNAAKAIGTAAVLSGNRIVMGAGIGWMADEFRAAGASFKDRGRRMDDMLVVVRKLLAGPPVEHHSAFYDFPPLQMSPAPTAPVPFWIGGHSDVALRRAAAHDGWIGVNYDEDEIDAILTRLQRFRQECGTAQEPFAITLAPNAPVTVELCRRLADRGVTGLVIPTWLARGEEPTTAEFKADSLQRLGETIIARVNREVA